LRLLELALAIAGTLVLLLLAGTCLLIFRWATRRIRTSEQRFWASFAHAPVGFALLSDQGRCVEINEALCNMLGVDREQLIDQPLDEIIELLEDETLEHLLRRATEGRRRFERRLQCADGSRLWGELSLRPIPGSPREAFIALVEDISEEKKRTEHLSWQATHDALTGLYNRSHFETMLEQAIEESGTGRSQHVLGFIDLDRFKEVNDNCGHAAGDALLGELALLMRRELRTSDLMARIGGDEFGFLLRDCPMHIGRSIAEELSNAVSGFTFKSQGREFALSASIGVAAIDGRFENVDQALKAVDSACYAAKGEGRDQVHVHEAATAPRRNSAGR
ncbi:MAG: diguanylate cyclase, partial [Halofilum sp. (in: g-proteobacteria)]|nr:diguanylate cyclase [Halofilum sp. (in: g-proteobacteria)]